MAVANGSDNLAVYVPLYASHSHSEGMFISLVFVVMIGLWCAGAVWLVDHPLLGAPIRRYGTALLPLILVVIGVSVIVQNDTLADRVRHLRRPPANDHETMIVPSGDHAGHRKSHGPCRDALLPARDAARPVFARANAQFDGICGCT